MKYGLFSLIVLILCTQAFGQNTATKLKTKTGVEVYVNARSFSRDFDKQIVELKDDVQVIYGEQSFSADQATVYLATEEIEASGRIVVQSATNKIYAQWMRLNYRTDTGQLRNAVIRSGQVTLEGAVIDKVGPDEYIAEKAYFTACDTCPPAWSFRGSRVKAKLGGYAHIKNAWFEIGHFPIIPIPYMIFPLKSERQTGVLIPSLGYENGTTFSDEFFWAISRSQDATFQIKNYQVRGTQGSVNYRYMLTDKSEGELTISGIPDQKFARDYRARLAEQNTGATYHRNTFNRWLLNYDHYYELPENFTQYTRLNLVSDLRYPRDFEKQMFLARNNRLPLNGEPAIENRVYLARQTENTFSGIDSSYYANLLKTDPLADNSDAVHRFPELRYSITQTKLADTDVLFRADINYVNFARQDFGYDDVFLNPTQSGLPNGHPCYYDPNTTDVTAGVCNERTPNSSVAGSGFGEYEPDKDVIRAGQRLQLSPELTYPVQISRTLDITPRLSYQHTRYSFNVSPNSAAQSPSYNFNLSPVDLQPTRDLVRSSVSVRTRMSRVYGDDLPKATRFRHEIEPEIIMSGVPYFRQSESRFLGRTARTPAFLESQPISDTDFTSQYTTTTPIGSQGIQFDYNDRIYNRTLATAILTNKFIRKSWNENTADYKQIVNFKLMQSYDFDQAKASPNRYPWSDIAALTSVRLDRFSIDSSVRYFPYHNKTNTSASLTARNKRGDYLSLGVTQNFLISENLEEAYDKRDETISTGGGLNLRYLRLVGQAKWLPTRWDLLQSRVKSWGGTIAIVPPGECWGVRTVFTQEIGSETRYEINFDWNNLGF